MTSRSSSPGRSDRGGGSSMVPNLPVDMSMLQDLSMLQVQMLGDLEFSWPCVRPLFVS